MSVNAVVVVAVKKEKTEEEEEIEVFGEVIEEKVDTYISKIVVIALSSLVTVPSHL